MPVTLSLSGTRLASHCDEVVSTMLALGINGDVTRNVSVVDGAVENGCRVLVASKDAKGDAKRLWDAVSTRARLQCAHVSGEERFSGCVLDVYRPSLCSGNADARR